jgi:signal transduction histidine kinase
LREALRALAGEGLVVLLPRRGAQVARLDSAEVDHIFPVMEALEALAGSLACDAMSDAQIAHAKALHARLVAEYKAEDEAAFFEVNRQIHEHILAGAGNPVLLRIYGGLSGQMRRARFMALNNRKQWREAVREPCEISALVREVSRLIEFELRGAGQRLVLELVNDLPRVRCDAVQIQQVVLNLIRNALEAMREGNCGEEVRVSTRVSGDGFLEISVLDDGPGVPPQIEARLFEPFVTTKKQGMGLGLSICTSIVSAHGGQLLHRPPSTGGAEFIVRLPLQGADEQ